jgi:hypothetical protein
MYARGALGDTTILKWMQISFNLEYDDMFCVSVPDRVEIETRKCY